MHRARFVSLCFTLLGFTGVAIFFFLQIKSKTFPSKNAITHCMYCDTCFGGLGPNLPRLRGLLVLSSCSSKWLDYFGFRYGTLAVLANLRVCVYGGVWGWGFARESRYRPCPVESGKGGHASLSMPLSYLVLVAAKIERRDIGGALSTDMVILAQCEGFLQRCQTYARCLPAFSRLALRDGKLLSHQGWFLPGPEENVQESRLV